MNKKAILIGNGFSSQLKPEFRNENMYNNLLIYDSNLIFKLNTKFDIFRYKINSKINLIYYIEYATYIKKYNSLNDIDKDAFDLHRKLKKHILKKISEKDFEKYFVNYYLIRETQQNKITSLETLLKAIDLFSKIDNDFNQEDVTKLKKTANKIYYNNGDLGINLKNYNLDKIRKYLNQFDYIFTTNFDLILEDIADNNKIFHLHGGFKFFSAIKKSNQILPPDKAYLIWGINEHDKIKQITRGNNKYPASYPFRYGRTDLEFMLDRLSESFDELHIFGYSGENDGHINKIIAKNENIKKIFIYVDFIGFKENEEYLTKKYYSQYSNFLYYHISKNEEYRYLLDTEIGQRNKLRGIKELKFRDRNELWNVWDLWVKNINIKI